MDPILALEQKRLEAAYNDAMRSFASQPSSGLPMATRPMHLASVNPNALLSMPRGDLRLMSPVQKQRFLFSVDPSSVHVNAPLPNISIRYHNRMLIADEVLPVVQVNKLSDLFYKYGATMGFELAKTDVSSQIGQPNQASPSYTTDSYVCTNHALRDYVPQQTMDNADAPLSPLIDSTEYLNEILRLARENRVAVQVFSSGNYGSNADALSGSARWDTATGTPISYILNTIIPAMTMFPTVAVIGEQAFWPLTNNPETKSFITNRPASLMGGTPFFMNEDTLAKAIGLEKFLVGKAKYNTVAEGGTASLGWIWGKSLAMLHVPPSPGIRRAAFGYTFRFGTWQTRSWYDQNLGVYGSHVIQVHHADAEKVIDTAGVTGYYVGTLVS